MVEFRVTRTGKRYEDSIFRRDLFAYTTEPTNSEYHCVDTRGCEPRHRVVAAGIRWVVNENLFSCHNFGSDHSKKDPTG